MSLTKNMTHDQTKLFELISNEKLHSVLFADCAELSDLLESFFLFGIHIIMMRFAQSLEKSNMG